MTHKMGMHPNKELDKKRVSLISEFVSQIEKYKEIKGYYPLGNGYFELPAVVYLSESIKEVDYPIHYNNVTIYDYENLFTELKKVLGKDFKQFNDPVEGYKKPSKYIAKYYLGGNTFLVTANMSSAVDKSYHNTFNPPQEKLYTNRSVIKKVTFYSGFMHRYSFASITDVDYFIFSLKDYKKLEKQKFKISKDPKELYQAISENNHKKVKRLIEKGIEINPYHKSFNMVNSPLIFAVKNNDMKLVKILIEAGADVNARGGYQDHVLIYAMGHKETNYEIIELLVKSGANVNTPNFFGISPFIGACKIGDLRLVNLFLKYGANLHLFFFYHKDGKFKRGYTPIETAIDSDQMEVIKILMKNGVKVNEQSLNIGLTPIEFAKKNKKEEAFKLMKSIEK